MSSYLVALIIGGIIGSIYTTKHPHVESEADVVAYLCSVVLAVMLLVEAIRLL